MIISHKTLSDYQQDGFVSGFTTKSLSEANRQLAVVRNATPENIRDMFKEQIRKVPNGYTWFWVLK